MNIATDSFTPFKVGTPVVAYGIETVITAIVAINCKQPELTNYTVKHIGCYMWHKELSLIETECTQTPTQEDWMKQGLITTQEGEEIRKAIALLGTIKDRLKAKGHQLACTPPADIYDYAEREDAYRFGIHDVETACSDLTHLLDEYVIEELFL